MKPSVCPAVSTAQRLHNEQRLAEFHRPVNRPLQSKIPVPPAAGNHPVKDICALTAGLLKIAFLNPRGRNSYRVHSAILDGSRLSVPPESSAQGSSISAA